jgi:hypothetical protein
MVEIGKSSRRLLKRLCAGNTLIEFRGDGRFSTWETEKDGSSSSVIGWVAGDLVAVGFVERIDDRAFIHSIGPTHECFRYSVTDAGRAYVAATLAPQELT